MEDFADFKEDIGSMIGNLTCVMTKLDMLDSALQVNLKLWTTDVWQQLDLKKTLAGEDPEWRQKMIGGYTDCYQVSPSLFHLIHLIHLKHLFHLTLARWPPTGLSRAWTGTRSPRSSDAT